MLYAWMVIMTLYFVNLINKNPVVGHADFHIFTYTYTVNGRKKIMTLSQTKAKKGSMKVYVGPHHFLLSPRNTDLGVVSVEHNIKSSILSKALFKYNFTPF